MRKKIIAIMMVGVSMLQAVPVYAEKPYLYLDKETVISVCDTYLSIRAESNSNSTEIGRIYANHSATLTGEVEGDWYQVESNGIKGWVFKDYVISNADAKKYVLNHLKDFDVRLKVQKAKGMYTDKSYISKDVFDYSIGAYFLNKKAKIYKTTKQVDKVNDKDSFQKMIRVTDDLVNIRKKNNKESVSLGFAMTGDVYKVLEEIDNYYKIKYNDKEGYINKEYCTTYKIPKKVSNISDIEYKEGVLYDVERVDTGIFKITVDDNVGYIFKSDTNVNISYMSECLATDILTQDQTYKVVDLSDDYCKIEVINPITKTKLYFYTDIEDVDLLVNLKGAEEIVKSIGDTSNLGETSDSGVSYHFDLDESTTTKERAKIVKYAMSFLGNPYVFGGEDLENGIDCSAFCQKVLQHFGKNIGRCTADQCSESAGQEISAKDIQVGDLIYYTHDGVNPYHVVMYLGKGKAVNASCPSYGICISNVKTDRILKIKNYID